MAARTWATVAALLVLALSSQLHAATALNILFIGNSVTYYNSGVDVVCPRFTGGSCHSNPAYVGATNMPEAGVLNAGHRNRE